MAAAAAGFEYTSLLPQHVSAGSGDKDKKEVKKESYHRELEAIWKHIQPLLVSPEKITSAEAMTLALRNSEHLECFARVTHLDLSKMKLSKYPDEMFNLPLTSLNLNGLELAELPEGLFRVNALKILDLSFNHLTHLDPRIAQLQKLSTLNITYNPFLAKNHLLIANTVLSISTLKKVAITDVGLKAVYAQQMAERNALRGVWKAIKAEVQATEPIQKLIGSDPQIREFFQLTIVRTAQIRGFFQMCEAGGIACFDTILKLDLKGYKLQTFPKEFCCMRKVQVIDLSENNIFIPPEPICAFKQLLVLKLEDNPINAHQVEVFKKWHREKLPHMREMVIKEGEPLHPSQPSSQGNSQVCILM